MFTKLLKIVGLAFGLAAMGISVVAVAHHSFSAEFDATKTVQVTGTITKVFWVNPHVAVYVDAVDGKGQTVSWTFDSWPPGSLRKAGINKSDFTVGDKVEVLAYGARTDAPLGYLRRVTFANKRVIEIGADPSAPAGSGPPVTPTKAE